MTKKYNNRWANIGMIAGGLLIVGAVVILGVTLLSQSAAKGKAAEVLRQLCAVMPAVHDTVVDDRVNMAMPAAEIGGESFCGIIELPAHNRKLPVFEAWQTGKLVGYPCRYMGSIYDGTLVIGGSDGEGQFDFVKTVSNEDIVFVTDMTGGRYRYAVTNIRRTDDVSAKALAALGADLVLFAKNTYALDYTVICCQFD